MSKKPIIGGIILAAIIGVVFVGAQINPDNPENEEVVFHVTLADPALYDCPTTSTVCKYRETVFLEEGIYEFRFVPNGDSPQKLSVELKCYISCADVNLPEHVSLHYVLVGNLVEEGMSSWYTWEYQIDSSQISLGFIKTKHQLPCELCVKIDEPQQVEISIDPRGYLNGPVSIELVQIK